MKRKYTKEQLREGCIDIEIGGYYCNTCRQWHPTLRWHSKFMSDYDEARYFATLHDAYQRFGGSITDDEIRQRYQDAVTGYGLIKSDTIVPCAVCADPTQYIDAASGAYVCSDACRAQFGWEPDPFPYDD